MPLIGQATATVRHVVALSGGKDSTAMALRLAEIEPRDYVYVCTPTGDEPPEMIAHWVKLGQMLGKPILPVVHHRGLMGLIQDQNALPNWRQRWCTRMLKIEPFAKWLMSIGTSVSYVGLRADEEEREGGDYLSVPTTRMRFPLREWGWGLTEVMQYLKDKDVAIPKRTDCNLCFFQRLIEWWDLWRDNPVAWQRGEDMEALTGHTFRSPGRDTWPASMEGLRKEFESGRIPKETRKDPLNAMQCRVCRM